MKISIEEIKNAKNGALKFSFDEKIKDINTDEPINAQIIFSTIATGLNTKIRAKGKIVANVKLECDRCLKEFFEKIEIDLDEIYLLQEHSDRVSQEVELKEGDFVTNLSGESEIDVEDLIYQSVILNLPNPSVCDINCRGGSHLEKYLAKESTDPRLEVFKNLKIENNK